MRVIAWSPHLTPERAAAAGVEFCASKEELFASADIVSVHMVLSPTTKGIIGAKELGLMKKSAFFINTSRGPLVDEDALVATLRAGGIAGAGLDVFDVEPLPHGHALRGLTNVTLTPHTGYVSDINYEVRCRVDNIRHTAHRAQRGGVGVLAADGGERWRVPRRSTDPRTAERELSDEDEGWALSEVRRRGRQKRRWISRV